MCCIKKLILFHSQYYANGGLPAGSSDDIRGVHGGRGGLGVVDQTRVVGIVLLHGPDGGVLDGLLFFQLHHTKTRISQQWLKVIFKTPKYRIVFFMVVVC